MGQNVPGTKCPNKKGKNVPGTNLPKKENGTKCIPKFYTRKTMKKVPNLAPFFIKKIVKNVEKKSIL